MNSNSVSSGKKIVFVLLTLSIGILISVGLFEGVFRFLESRTNHENEYIGRGGLWIPDKRWGWKPDRGHYRVKTDEFTVEGDVNSLNMNDEPLDSAAELTLTRVFVLGDSHTYATGVSMKQTWAKILQNKLNASDQRRAFRVYNGGVTGFNMHQYLLRLIDQGPMLRPDYVILGVSYATDLYDLLPPDHGGWIYGGDWQRDYFDLDEAGKLKERHWEPTKTTASIGETPTNSAQDIRKFLDNFATFRYLRRSNLALWIGSHVKVGGQTLWPNMEIVVEKQTPPEHEYQWRLFEALLSRIKQESEHQNAKLIVLGIPYIAQLYDEIWKVSFGNDPRYSQTAAIERVQRICQTYGISYVDTLDAMRAKYMQTGRWLHYRKDAHPTAEGHEVIADTLFKSGLIQPRP